jgi:hypothetical protein
MRGHCIYFGEEVCLIWKEMIVENWKDEKPPIRRSAFPEKFYWTGAPEASASCPMAKRITPD